MVRDNNNLIDINDNKRFFIFITLVLISTFSSCDGGIIPQQNEVIKNDFGGEEPRIGLFGSIDYIGRVFGAINR